MVIINIFGSSHCTKFHKFPQTFTKELKNSPSVAKKFTIGELKGYSGGRIFDNGLTEEILDVAKKTASAPDYCGQIVVLILGSNDWASYQMTSEKFRERYISVVEKFLLIPKTGLLLASVPPRGSEARNRSDMSGANKVIKMIAKSYQAQVLNNDY